MPAVPRQPATGSGAPSTVRVPGLVGSARRARGAVRLARRESGSRVRAESARPIQARARLCPRARCTAPLGRPPRGRARDGRWNPARDRSSARRTSSAEVGRGPFASTPERWPHLIEALTRRVCHRVLPLIVLWGCRFATPAGQLGPGWCNLSKGCSRMCSLPTWWPCSSARRSARLRPRRSTTTPTPSKPLLGAPGCDRASESCRVVR